MYIDSDMKLSRSSLINCPNKLLSTYKSLYIRIDEEG